MKIQTQWVVTPRKQTTNNLQRKKQLQMSELVKHTEEILKIIRIVFIIPSHKLKKYFLDILNAPNKY